MKKIFLTSGIMMCVVMPAMAVPTNTSNTFPNDELMQADYTYTNQATYNNMGVYSDSVDADANYDWELVTVNAGYYLPANSTTPVQCTSGNYCPGLAQQVHLDDTNAQGLTACPSGFTSSAVGAIADTQCFRACDVANMGTNGTITTIAHASTLSGNDYYGNGTDTCTVSACENGYHVDNNACAANTITINWNGATAAAISANNAGTTVYGGDIRTPQSIDPSQVPVGKRFVGWKFVKLFNLSTLDASIDGTAYGYQNDSTGQEGAKSRNTTEYGLTSDQTWGTTFSYGKIRGEARCSTKSGDNHDYAWGGNSSDWTASESELTGNGVGQYCWCKATQYQASGSNEWQNVSSSSWVFYNDSAVNGGDAVDCAGSCALYCAADVPENSAFRGAVFGVSGN